jgi:hypothetical protein
LILREWRYFRARGLLPYIVDVVFLSVAGLVDLILALKLRLRGREPTLYQTSIKCPECLGSEGKHVMGCSRTR